MFQMKIFCELKKYLLRQCLTPRWAEGNSVRKIHYSNVGSCWEFRLDSICGTILWRAWQWPPSGDRLPRHTRLLWFAHSRSRMLRLRHAESRPLTGTAEELVWIACMLEAMTVDWILHLDRRDSRATKRYTCSLRGLPLLRKTREELCKLCRTSVRKGTHRTSPRFTCRRNNSHPKKTI